MIPRDNKVSVFKWAMTLAALFITFIIPMFFNEGIGELSADAVSMCCIFVGAIILWLFVGIDWTLSIIFISLALLPQSGGISGVISASFGNSTIMFLIFSMILTNGISQTGLLRRIAIKFIDSKFAYRGAFSFLFMFLLSEFLIGLFIAPTVLFVMYQALLDEIYLVSGGNITSEEDSKTYYKLLMVGMAIVASISCATTPIAHTFPLMAIGFLEADTGMSVSYLEYMKWGVPIGVTLFAVLLFMFWLSNRKIFKNYRVRKRERLFSESKMEFPEVFSGIVFAAVIIMWVLQGVLDHPLLNSLGTSGIALVGIYVLCVVTDSKSSRIMDFKSAVGSVSWSSIFLCASTLAVGKFLALDELGITSFVGNVLTGVFDSMTVHLFLLSIIGFTILLTNLISNIVTVTITYNLIMPLAYGIASISAVITPVMITVLLGICSSLAYATPSSIAHIALAGSSEYANTKDMLVYGGMFMVVSTFIVYFYTFIR